VWALVNQTPFASEGTFCVDKNGADLWLVVVKGSFAISLQGTTDVASTQVPVFFEPQFRGDPRISSLVYESDLDFPKLTTDVLLNGSAYAPKGETRRILEVTMIVAGRKKSLTVNGDSLWEWGPIGPRVGDAAPFESMPIVYERAFGGYSPKPEGMPSADWEAKNPAGVGFASNESLAAGLPVANIQRPGAAISSWRDRPPPAGFGPIARHWHPRALYAGTYDELWLQRRFPLLPLDFDERFHQCSPEDQRPASFLSGGERIELSNLTASGQLIFRLPSESLVFRTSIDDDVTEHRSKLYTVAIEPSYPRVLMTWVSALPCHGRKYKLQRTVILRKKRSSLAEQVQKRKHAQ
jgi:hypothetical protein